MSYTKILNRRGTTANWSSTNPILSAGEIGLDLDLHKIKFGDGSTAWNDLDYGLGSAYDIALNNGFEGTEQEWLDSLIGPQGDPGATGLNWQGPWSDTADYVNDDAVYYSGASWFASGDPTVGEEPTLSATHWYPLALQGATGAASTVAGPPGADGGWYTTQIVESKASSYAIVSGDAGKLIMNSAAITITVNNVLSIGQQIDFFQNQDVQITFIAGTGVTIRSKNSNLKTAGQYSPASVKCISSGVYALIGDLGV